MLQPVFPSLDGWPPMVFVGEVLITEIVAGQAMQALDGIETDGWVFIVQILYQLSSVGGAVVADILLDGGDFQGWVFAFDA